MKANKKGFTLIELIIVVIIIGILSAIAAPIMSSNVTNAKRSEGITGCGTIRTAAKLYMAASGGTAAANLGQLNNYLAQSDLNGPNYNGADYAYDGTNCTATTAKFTGGNINMGAAIGNIF